MIDSCLSCYPCVMLPITTCCLNHTFSCLKFPGQLFLTPDVTLHDSPNSTTWQILASRNLKCWSSTHFSGKNIFQISVWEYWWLLRTVAILHSATVKFNALQISSQSWFLKSIWILTCIYWDKSKIILYN